jgi:uncharacterized lipoprotein YajG
MQRNLKYVVALLSIQLLALCSCSPQKNLAQRLKGTDRVVVTNTIERLSISVTGADADKIVQAIATAKKESPLIEAAAGLTLEFYKGAEQLGTVATGYEIFSIDGKPYRDTTGTLKAVEERFRDEHPPMAR